MAPSTCRQKHSSPVIVSELEADSSEDNANASEAGTNASDMGTDTLDDDLPSDEEDYISPPPTQRRGGNYNKKKSNSTADAIKTHKRVPKRSPQADIMEHEDDETPANDETEEEVSDDKRLPLKLKLSHNPACQLVFDRAVENHKLEKVKELTKKNKKQGKRTSDDPFLETDKQELVLDDLEPTEIPQ
ncbi:unnamed protein product [Cyclocybe aegerita]|uniref:Uncharacterized protein n=1 Tax=Cyclocybe aegerita TaxID=1973307 RepID=A0A8S0WWL8_CYCAE|nr:unnamed protein product [Cyclocybe aegerita]